MTVLLVDAANVVGSRPDGWWRDRAGAAARLLDRLAALPGRPLTGPDGDDAACTEVVAVVEGQARDVAGAGRRGRSCGRAGSGDDALAAEAAPARPRGDAAAGRHRRPGAARAAAGRRRRWPAPAGCWAGSTRSVVHHRSDAGAAG